MSFSPKNLEAQAFEVNGMSDTLTKLREVFKEYPFLRGSLSYAILWPLSCITQEYLEHGKSFSRIDWARAARFSFFGALLMSPLYYNWLKLTYPYFQGNDLATAIVRAVFEQVTIGPFSLVYFFFLMSLLERQSLGACINEVKEKFWPTYKAGSLYWPAAQTINFYFMSEENRLVFRSLASFIWIIYMAHMKGKARGVHSRRSRRARRRTSPSRDNRSHGHL